MARLPTNNAEITQASAPPSLWGSVWLAPTNRSIYLTDAPETDAEGVLSYWRTSRVKLRGERGWAPVSYWASMLTRRRLDFEPTGWREAAGGAAVAALAEREAQAARELAEQRERQQAIRDREAA